MVTLIDRDVPRPSTSPHLVVVGAGMSGLVAAGLLRKWGYRVTVLEASSLVGGRIRTIRSPFSLGLYCEAGAMRIPTSHRLVHAYIDRVGLNSKLTKFTGEVPENLIYVNGVKTTFGQYRVDPDILQYPVASFEKGRVADELWENATGSILSFIRQNPAANWPRVVEHYDRHSIWTFLMDLQRRRVPRVSEAAIEMMGVLLNAESVMMASFLEGIRDQMEISSNASYYELLGGNDQLPWAMVGYYGLADHIQFNARMTAVSQTPWGVSIEYESPFHGRRIVTCDGAIITIPFAALRMVDVEAASFCREKLKAIRALKYDKATKVMLEFRSRFWESRDGILGGCSVTDLPIRFVYYPNHTTGDPGPAVMTASYTWCEDSARWDSMPERDRIRCAMRDLAVLHGDVVYEEFRHGISHSWLLDPHSCGAFALFGPGQETQLHKWVGRREGRIHFAGEHTTLRHGWIEGAIESGIRAAVEVHPIAASGLGPLHVRGRAFNGGPVTTPAANGACAGRPVMAREG
jgi:monoamine oxidase